MIAIAEHLAAPRVGAIPERGIDMLRCRDLEPLHALRERALVLRLDEHMHVTVLQTRVNDPEAPAARRRDRRVADRLVHVPPPQIPHRRADAHHHMQRLIRFEVRPCLMPLAGSCSARLSAGTTPLATASEQRLLNMPPALRPRRHVHIIISDTSIVN